MTQHLQGPGTPFSLLFDDDQTAGRSLPSAFQEIYGGDWRQPSAAEQPYTFINFVTSRDGRISFDIPGRDGGGDISRNMPHDKWLMALLRARADAVLVGASTLRVARKHRWTPEAVFKADTDAFAALRTAEGRAVRPLLVIATKSGKLPPDALVLAKPRQPVLIATTEGGAEQARATLDPSEEITYHVSPGDELNLPQLLRDLRTAYGVADLLSEGGATLYGALLSARVQLDEFLTVSPIIVGNPARPAPPRTSLIEGVGFDPDSPPTIDLLSMRRVGSYLFHHSRYRHSAK